MRLLCGLVAFGLDGTLLRGPTVCELIARSLGRLPETQRFEADPSRAGVHAARLAKARWYRGHTRAALCAGLRDATWAPGAREAVRALKRSGIEVAIASVTWHFAVAWFARSLGVRHFVGIGLARTGEVSHVWPADKAAWLRSLGRALGISRRRMAAVGDSAGDRHLLRAATLRFFVGREAPGIPQLTHLPAADLREVAQSILQHWT
jgi:phosphoserine phosphatase